MTTLDCIQARLPHDLLPDRALPEGPGQRSKLRPDILMIELPTDGPRRVTIDVGYCSVARYDEKCDEKIRQHDALRQLLLAQGYIVKMALLILGNADFVYINYQILLTELAVAQPTVELLVHLSGHAIRLLHKTIRTRRQLDHASTAESLRPDPP